MHQFDVIPFNASDGFKCNLWRLKTNNPYSKGPVLLVHGAGVSSNIFNAPTEKNLIDALSEDGYDVWLENWRGSILCANNQWDLDVVAENDHPAAVKEVCRLTGHATIKAIIHCQGSTSFMISVMKGLVPQVTTLVSNAVSLHPILPGFSKFKINNLLPVLKHFISNLNPKWGDNAYTFKEKLLRFLVNITHWENDTKVGKFVSFTYGAGYPALWELKNLSDTTKNWIRDQFGYVPMSFFEHMKKCVAAGTLVSVDGKVNYCASTPETVTRFAFFAGKLNKCFLSQSQINTYNYFNNAQPNRHSLYVYDTYSHLDIFFGENAYTDIFPSMIKELNK